MLEQFKDWVIPVASIGLTYILGRLHSLQSDKKLAYKEAYDNFYVPYITLLYKSGIGHMPFSKLEMLTRQKLFKMVTENIKYVDNAILEYVDILQFHYDVVVVNELLKTKPFFLTPERLDEIFDELTKRVLTRATKIARRLHQPQLGKFALDVYLDNREERERLEKLVLSSNSHTPQTTDKP